MQKKDLWPADLFSSELTAPVTVLKEQAEFLSERSGREILGKVSTTSSHVGYSSESDIRVQHSFELEVPAMGGYTFKLFEAVHRARLLYPVNIEFHLGDNFDNSDQVPLGNEEQLRKALGWIFRHEETIGIIRTLMAQTRDPDSLPPPLPKKKGTSDDFGDDDDIPF